MISIQKKFLFVHIPKTGGNSIQEILKEYSEDRILTTNPRQDGINRFELRNDRYNIEKHSTLAVYKRELEPELFAELYKFTVIRNPWELMISLYFSPHRQLTRWDRKYFIKLLKHTEPLRHYITAPTVWQRIWGRRIPLMSAIDDFIRYENLEADFHKICTRIQIPQKPLPLRNKSKRDHYSVYYDDELIELVRSRFQEEIDFGGYHFEAMKS